MEVGANEMLSKFKYRIHFKGTNKERLKIKDSMKTDNGGGKKIYEDLSARRERRKRKYGIG